MSINPSVHIKSLSKFVFTIKINVFAIWQHFDVQNCKSNIFQFSYKLDIFCDFFKHCVQGENCLIAKPKTHVVLDFISGVTNLE